MTHTLYSLKTPNVNNNFLEIKWQQRKRSWRKFQLFRTVKSKSRTSRENRKLSGRFVTAVPETWFCIILFYFRRMPTYRAHLWFFIIINQPRQPVFFFFGCLLIKKLFMCIYFSHNNLATGIFRVFRLPLNSKSKQPVTRATNRLKS